MIRLAQHFGAILILAILLISPVSAQVGLATTTGSGTPETSAPSVEELTPEMVDSMVARMSDDEVRELLLYQLDAVASENVAPESTLTFGQKVSRLWTAFTSPTLDALKKLPAVMPGLAEAVGNFSTSFGGGGGVLTLFGLIALVVAVALGVEYAVRAWLARSSRVVVNEDGETSLRDALSFLFKRFMREIFGLVIFFVVLRMLGRVILTPEQIAFAGPFVFNLIWIPRLTAAVSRLILAPHRSDLRLVNADDHWAQYLHRNVVGLFFLAGFTLFFVQFTITNGVPSSETRLAFWLDTLVYVYIVMIALTAREGLINLMRGDDPDRTEADENAASLYPYFAIVVAVGTWALVSTLIGLGITKPLFHGAHYLTMFLLLMAPVIDTAIRGLVKHVVPPMTGEGPAAEKAYHQTKRSLVRIGRVIAAGIIIIMIANAWDFSIAALMQSGPGIADNIFSFLMTLVVGYVVYEGVSLWINMRLAAEMTALGMSEEDADAEMGGASGSRLSTVLPLMLLTARSAIIVIFGLLAIGNLGIDITPLLAGAGILGLAIGFGAQRLVTDIVSGVFFLVDDAFRTGEYVEIDGTMGAVEKISIRSMQLRHHRGPVHTIPYGEIPKLTNYSRDWVIMKLKFTVPFDTDPNKVKKIFKKIGQEMLQDELFKDDFLQPFKSQGVFDIDDVGMVIRGKFMAKPGKQFMIRKEIYNKVKAAFAENGIDFARREVRVALPDMEHHEDLTEEQKAAITGAAAVAAQQEEQGPAAAPKGPD